MGKSGLISLTFAMALSGCSLAIPFIMPRAHDPVMFSDAVDIKLLLAATSCDDKQYKWNELLEKTDRLKVYTDLRKDPQADNIKGLHEAVGKAKNSSNAYFCRSVLELQRKRIDAAIEAWRGR